ncbi:MAG: branched-chain amino acid ABC transporter permease [Lacrimispora sp.]|uniref:branched-chain amino acid ABC transporter permease n=1 Tax=Lacrimispora sp. TaxID=2719234 RepID=UPI0039E58EB7
MNQTLKSAISNRKNDFIILVVLLLLPMLFNAFSFEYAFTIASFIFIYIVAVSGLDIVFGYSGQISLGHAAFFAIGAYGSAILHKHVHIPVVLTMIIAAFIAAIIGAALAYPASKLVFHFLSLATIAFGEIVYQLVAQSPGEITGNFTGFFTESVNIFGFKLNTYSKFYYFGLLCVVVFLTIKNNLIKSKVGRAFIAIRENSHAADGMGINVRNYKILAFSISAFFTAFAGGMYAHCVRFISPDTFMYKQSVMFLTMLLFGGTASRFGPIFGAVSVLILNEALRATEKYQLLIYGVLLLIVIVGLPGGLYGAFQDIVAKFKKKGAK